MYESYSWPGAYGFKDEVKHFITWFKNLFNGIHKKIVETEKKVF